MFLDKIKTQLIQAHDLSEFEHVIRNSDNTTLVVFDIDDVILTSKDQILHPKHKEHLDRFMEGINKKFSPQQIGTFATIMNKGHKKTIVDQKIYAIFDYLLNNKIMTIALTHWPTGNMADNSKYEHLRILQLQEFGIDFHMLAPFKDEISLVEIQGKNGIPLMHKGVVLTGLIEKGTVLENILNKIDFKPKKVIFIDDLIENIISVESSCIKLGIEFIGFEYVAVANIPTGDFNEKRAEIQFENLINEKIWLSDEDADLRLNKAH